MKTTIDAASIPITPELKAWLEDNSLATPGTKYADSVLRKRVVEALTDGRLDNETFAKLVGVDDDEEDEDEPPARGTKSGSRKRSEAIFGGTPQAKTPASMYSDKRWSAVHAKTGEQVFDEVGTPITRPSQLSLAMNGVLLKHAARKAGISVDWSEHDQALLTHIADTQPLASYQGPPDQVKMFAPGVMKAPLLDDSTSGGLEATPIVFDQDVIVTPLLTGEVLPEVDLKPISRGRRIEGASFGTPTAQWGQGDATEGDLFDSTSQIAALDSTVYDLSCHVLVGRNFMSDSPLQIGSLLTAAIGERMLWELERVICEGSGTEPSGIKGAAGTTSVSFGSAAATVGKYVELLFAVPKELRTGSNRFAFVANETTYRRARAIATGVTGDTRLVFGMSIEDYAIFQRPFKIAHHLANTEILAGALNRYRLYRRLGSQIEWTMQGENLQRRNEALLTVRQRWAGRVMLPSAFAVVTTAEA
jgi:HK97 family phage major capsid protein